MTEVSRYWTNGDGYLFVCSPAWEPKDDDLVMWPDFKRVIAERDALQLRLNAADERIDELTKFELQQPVAPWFYFVECDDPDYSGLFNHESEAQTQANDHGGEVVKLWNVPPTWRPSEKIERAVEVLAEAREWLGDGKHADGLAREHWTPEYAALIDRIDATLSK